MRRRILFHNSVNARGKADEAKGFVAAISGMSADDGATRVGEGDYSVRQELHLAPSVVAVNIMVNQDTNITLRHYRTLRRWFDRRS